MAKKKVETDPEDVLSSKAIAESIVNIDKAIKKLHNSGLRQRTMVLLISDASGVARATVKKVIEGMDELKDRYLN